VCSHAAQSIFTKSPGPRSSILAGLARGGASGLAPTQKRRLLRQGRFGEMLQKRRFAAREFIRKRLAEGGKSNGLAAFWAEHGTLQL
jgi:hypothetical protein